MDMDEELVRKDILVLSLCLLISVFSITVAYLLGHSDVAMIMLFPVILNIFLIILVLSIAGSVHNSKISSESYENDVLLTATGRAVCASDVFRCSCGSLNVHLIGTLLKGKLELAAMRCNDCDKEWLMVWSPWYDHAWDVFKRLLNKNMNERRFGK